MHPFSDPADSGESPTSSSLSTTAPDRATPQDWEESGEGEDNRYARAMHGGAPARAFYTGTDVSHELVYLVNDHALDPITVPVSETAPAASPTEADTEDQNTPSAAQNTLTPEGDAPTAKGESSTAHETMSHSAGPQVKGEQSLKIPSPHAADNKAVAHVIPPEQHYDEAHPQADHSAVTSHHAAPMQENYQGISHHDPLLADIIPLNSMPAGVVATASPDSGAALPAAGDLLTAAPEQLFSTSEIGGSATASAFELNDVVGEEPPASWNSHQPASDDGIVAVMPPVTPTELEQTEMHHLF